MGSLKARQDGHVGGWPVGVHLHVAEAQEEACGEDALNSGIWISPDILRAGRGRSLTVAHMRWPPP